MTISSAPGLIDVASISKSFGNVRALHDVSMSVFSGEVHCLLGDNGAGKSTLIKVLSGVHPPDNGEMRIDGDPVRFGSPRDALRAGIATAYQDLAMIPLMSISRNFFLGNEPTAGWGPFRRFDVATADEITRVELNQMGIAIRDTSQPVGTLSGGERQSVAIARAVYFGARILILDEPTAALGVRQAGVVLRYIARAREQGLGVIFITHNVHHAWAIGNRFTLLSQGRSEGTYLKGETSREQISSLMAGGAALEELEHELGRDAPPSAASWPRPESDEGERPTPPLGD
ncbi:MAG: sugar ABC transporter ATP-binding protein [Chloroflexia bacterium]|nr:sugar ABC transporter ATP-binding protein [Chloroflexia bacterium]